jgi:stage V sporulation protein B
MSRQTFLQGTLILLFAGLISRLLGFVPRMILPRLIGTEGVGLYQMAFPLLIFFITIARFGLNVSISKIVAEASEKRDYVKIRRALIVSTMIVLFLSLILTPVVIASSFLLSKYFYTDERVLYPLLAMTPMIPIIALSTIIRGYFQGRHNMIPTAVSSVIESLVRIIGVIVISSLLLPYGLGMAAAGVMIGVGIGEVASLLYLFTNFRKMGRKLIKPKAKVVSNVHQLKDIFKELWNISMPVTASGLIGSISYAIEPMVVAQSLALAGISATMATSLYGELSGLAIYLIWFPTTLTYSLSISLVPAVSAAYAQKKESIILQRLNQSLRLTLVLTMPFTILFYLYGNEICAILFDAPQIGALLKILAPFSIFLYFQSSLGATLQGLDMAKAAFYNSLYGAIIKTGMIFLLASRPEFGIHGVAIAINMSMTLVTLLHFFSLSKRIRIPLDLIGYLKVIFAAVVSGLLSKQVYHLFEVRHTVVWTMMVMLLSFFLFYLMIMVVLKAVGRQDMERIPWIGKWIAPLFPYR